MKIIQGFILTSFIMLISTLALAGNAQISRNAVSVTDGPDFCQKAQSFISDLNTFNSLNIRIVQCDIQEDGWFSDTVQISLSYQHKNCLKEEYYFRPIHFEYSGVHYIDATKQILEDIGLKFIAQTNNDSTLVRANNGPYQISIGIPRCMDEK